MFGFGKKKESGPQRPERAKRSEDFEERKAQSRAQLGFLVGIDDDTGETGGMGGSLEVDDGDLEDELMMLLGDSPVKPKPKSSPVPRQRQSAPAQQRSKVSNNGVVDSLDFNINLQDEGHDNHDDDIDLDDPDLQSELAEILGDPVPPKPVAPHVQDNVPQSSVASTMTKDELVKLLQERLELYEKAKANADTAGDSGKSRRFTRGVKTLKELMTKAKAGRAIDEADIPPIVSLGSASKPSAISPSSVPSELPSKCASAPAQKVLEPEPESLETYSHPSIPPDHFSPSPQPNLPEPLQPVPIFQPVFVKPAPEPPIDYDKLEDVPKLPVASIETDAELRLKEYRKMAVNLKRNQDTQGALQYLKLSKALEAAINSGEPVNLTQFPIGQFPELPSAESTTTDEQKISSFNPSVPPAVEPETAQTQSGTENPSDDIFGAPPPPQTVMQALEQRLIKYKSEIEKANSSSNASKARRMGRIVKQYEEAIVLYKKGKSVPFDELPTPPGFAPIPVPGVTGAGPASLPGSIPDPAQVNPRPQPRLQPSAADDSVSPEKKIKPGPGPSTPVTAGSIYRGGGKPVTKLTLQEKQLALITLRQKQYRDGAIEAKKRGDINQAREYLRISKGFDNLIEASKSGLPVDLATLPSPPEAISALEAEGFEVVNDGDCIIPSENVTEVFTKLEEDLRQQLKMCMQTRDHFKSIGDVASANRFESMAIDTKKDLDTLRIAGKKGNELPRYHYETRIFSITDCNTDIKEDEIEISVLQGVNFKGSSSLDTYIRVELPYPSAEEAQSQKSHVVKDSTDPVYNVTYKMNINRTARNFQRFVHRHGVKFEVWSKGGFLRSSTLLGTATAKLQPLESKCNLHDAFDILDGRKVVGKLEVKIRIRDPVVTKQITQKKEKWLSIDRA